jgi:hypothetical protein
MLRLAPDRWCSDLIIGSRCGKKCPRPGAGAAHDFEHSGKRLVGDFGRARAFDAHRQKLIGVCRRQTVCG